MPLVKPSFGKVLAGSVIASSLISAATSIEDAPGSPIRDQETKLREESTPSLSDLSNAASGLYEIAQVIRDQLAELLHARVDVATIHAESGESLGYLIDEGSRHAIFFEHSSALGQALVGEIHHLHSSGALLTPERKRDFATRFTLGFNQLLERHAESAVWIDMSVSTEVSDHGDVVIDKDGIKIALLSHLSFRGYLQESLRTLFAGLEELGYVSDLSIIEATHNRQGQFEISGAISSFSNPSEFRIFRAVLKDALPHWPDAFVTKLSVEIDQEGDRLRTFSLTFCDRMVERDSESALPHSLEWDLARLTAVRELQALSSKEPRNDELKNRVMKAQQMFASGFFARFQ